MARFNVDQRYTRSDVVMSLGLPELPSGGPWNTGYHEYNGEIFIFCNVGVPGRTGHNYSNVFVGDRLHWQGKTGTRANQPLIASMCRPEARVHVFWRDQDRSPFRYAGLATAEQVEPSIPVKVIWSFRSEAGEHVGSSAEEVDIPQAQLALLEGAVLQVHVNAYERNPQARARCITIHGETCKACGFNFEQAYGPLGKSFIHVHHVVPISSLGASYIINPVTDLVPLCPNCHAMVHRQNPPMSVDELSEILAIRNQQPSK